MSSQDEPPGDDSDTGVRPGRRAFLVTSSTALVALAGCTGLGGDGNTNDGNGTDDDGNGADDTDDGNGTDDGSGGASNMVLSIVESPDVVSVGEEATVAYEVENTGDSERTQSVVLQTDGTQRSETEVTLAGGDSQAGELSYTADATFDGLESAVSVTIASDDDEVSVDILTVKQPTDGGVADVIAWNRELLEVIRLTGETSTETVRRIAILTTAMFDAATTVEAARGNSHYQPYGSYDGAPADASPLAALAGSAWEALSGVYPGFVPRFDRRLAATLERATHLDGNVAAGEEWGRSVGAQTVQKREDDGHDEPESGGYEPCPDQNTEGTPGCWRGGSLGTWQDSHYAFLDTWVLDEPYEFDGPPALDSEAYAEAWQEVYDIGDDRNREERPDEHVEIAQYWRGGTGTTRPSGRWLRIANVAVESGEFDLSMLETTRLMAFMGLALGDSGVSTWNGKHTHGFWRPAEAIEFGDTDGNPDTFADPEWESIAVGSSPEHPAGLACYGGAGKTILVDVLGTDDFTFEMTSSGPPELTRGFESFSDAMEESWMSRLYVGNHFRFSLEEGVAAGEAIAETILEEELQPVE